MPKKKMSEEIPKGISQLGVVYDVQGVTLDTYVWQDSIKRLSEKFGKKINVISLAFSVPETKTSIILFANPEEKGKCIMIATHKDSAKDFYEALLAMKENKGE